jgi:hypothetical protein
LLGSKGYFKEESRVRRPKIKNPAHRAQRTVKLANLWRHLPEPTRLQAIVVATRMLKSHVTPQEAEVKHEDA